ncbi:DUF3784 domain-containing protein [Priestia megaterium]|uniref:DUF3784 domain-containing protein n=1 Tax=Priestia megaterium TaxID=1404 RepID=UPI0022B8CD0B|nr:DUF3784 domain-containing protein [Priestia megaterium]MCZ8497366.1 DUF3784 domain-containing protein [Priestia megaterium]
MLVNLLIGIIFISFGCIIWTGRLLFLIAGYKDGKLNGKKIDERKLSKLMGAFLVLVGIFTILTPYFY